MIFLFLACGKCVRLKEITISGTPGPFAINSFIECHGVNMNGWKIQFLYESREVHAITLKTNTIQWLQSGKYGLIISQSDSQKKFIFNEYEACPAIKQTKHCFEVKPFTIFIIKGLANIPEITAEEIINGFEIVNKCKFPVLVNFNNIKFEGHRYTSLGLIGGSFSGTSLIVLGEDDAAAFRNPEYNGNGENFFVTCISSCSDENEDVTYRYDYTFDEPCYCLADTGEVFNFNFTESEQTDPDNILNGYTVYNYVINTPTMYTTITAASACIIHVESTIQPLLILIIGSSFSKINITWYNQTTTYDNILSDATFIDSGNTSIFVDILAYSGFQAIAQSVGGETRLIGYTDSLTVQIDNSVKFLMLWGDDYDIWPECTVLEYVPPKNKEREKFSNFLARLSPGCTHGQVVVKSILEKTALTIYNIDQYPVMKSIRVFNNLNDFAFFIQGRKRFIKIVLISIGSASLFAFLIVLFFCFYYKIFSRNGVDVNEIKSGSIAWVRIK